MADCIGHPSGWLVSLRPVRLTLYSLPPVLALLVVGLKTNLNEVIMANIATVAPIATEQNLIPVFNTTIGNIVQQAVDARVLHDFMQIKRDFTNWIKARIAKYGFVENQDFEVFANSGENSHLGQNIDSPNLANQKGRGGDRRSIDYHLTLDMAKELSMVENNDKGREARRYFIECERKAHEAAIPFCPHKDIQDELYRVSGGKRTVMVELSRLLRDRFGVARYFDIPVHQCKAAVEYVRSFENTKWHKKESLPLFDKHLSQAELLGQQMIQLYKQGKLNDDDIRVLSDLMHNLAKQKPVNQVVQVQPLAAISTTDQDKVSYAYAIAAEVASCASKTVFNAVLAQKEWKHTRFVFGLTNNSPTHYVPYALKIDDRAMITTVAELPMRLLSVDLQVGNKELFDIAAACNHKLSMRFDQKLLIN